MKNYTLIPVTSSQDQEDFVQMTKQLYKGVKNYVQPLDIDVENVFNPQKNAFFKHGECMRWLLKNADGTVIGRVAAFIDRNILDAYEQPTGGMGFFECINDKKAAFQLFDVCKDWLKERGMEAMDGPINFGARLQFWGLHVFGNHRPVYGMFYHHSYYQKFFEDYGFKDFFQQYNYRLELKKESLSRIILLKARRVYRDKQFRTEFFDKKQVSKFVKDFVTIYNNTWIGEIPGVEAVTEEEITETFQLMRPVLEEKYMIFAYYGDRPVGFFIMTPDINEILQHVKGKFNLKAKIHFLIYKYLKKNKTVVGQIFGIDRDFQKRGIESILIEKFSQVIFPGKEPFKYLEFNWIGDFNPRMQHLVEDYLNGKLRKKYITYRYLFDRNKPFKRAEKLQ